MPVSAARRATALHGASTDYFSPYATTSSVASVHATNGPRPPATPWMGDSQSRHDRMPSGFQKQYMRDAPPGDARLDDTTSHKTSHNWPTATPVVTYTGDKNKMPMKSCLHRFADRTPRYYPFAIAAGHNAESLIAPPDVPTSERFVKPSIWNALNTPGEAGRAFVAVTQKDSMPPAQSGFAMMQGPSDAYKLMTAPQTDGFTREPALTLLGAERVAADSTRRFFHSRDYSESPFLSTSRYYDEDNDAQIVDQLGKQAGMDAAKNARPNTGFARVTFTQPFASDVGDGIFSVTQKVPTYPLTHCRSPARPHPNPLPSSTHPPHTHPPYRLAQGPLQAGGTRGAPSRPSIAR